MPVVLAPLLLLAALIVALGLIKSGQAFVDSLTFIIRKTVGRVPLIGGLLATPAVVLLQALSHNMGEYANNIGADVAKTWHYAATVVDRLGWTMFHLSEAIAKVAWYVEVQWPLNQLWEKAHDAYNLARHAAHSAGQITKVTTVVKKFYTVPAKSPLLPAIRVATRPIRVDLDAFERWTRTQLAAMSAAVAGVGSISVPLPRNPFAGLGDQLGKIRARLRRLEAGDAKLVGLGALGFALARLGMGWARCTNVKNTGKQICRADSDLLGSLLGGLLLIFGTVSLLDLARGMQEITDEVTQAARAFIREASALDDGDVPAHAPFGIELPPGA